MRVGEGRHGILLGHKNQKVKPDTYECTGVPEAGLSWREKKSPASDSHVWLRRNSEGTYRIALCWYVITSSPIFNVHAPCLGPRTCWVLVHSRVCPILMPVTRWSQATIRLLLCRTLALHEFNPEDLPTWTQHGPQNMLSPCPFKGVHPILMLVSRRSRATIRL